MYVLNAIASYIQLVIKHLRQELFKMNIFAVHVSLVSLKDTTLLNW